MPAASIILTDVRTLECISLLPSNAVFHYENRILDVVGSGELMRLRGWGSPQASRKVTDQDWAPFLPGFRIIWPGSLEDSPHRGQTGAVSRDMESAFHGFRSDLPDEIVVAVEPFSGHQWNLLLLIHRRPEALDLARGSPALAWCLANCDQFRSVYGQSPADWAQWRVHDRQTAILEWLGFPGTRSMVNLLRKLAPACVDPASMRTLRNTLRNDPRATKLLRHQVRINAGVHRLCCCRRLADVATPSLVQEAAADPREEHGSPRANLLADTLDLWECLNRSGAPPPFISLERIQRVHDELLLEYQRRLEVSKREARRKARGEFPPPPIPGTDSIIPLCSKAELELESKEQRNCVGAYYQRILNMNRVYIYKVLHPQRATLSLVCRSDGTWCRGELKASGNKPARAGTRAAIDYWLLQQTHRCKGLRRLETC